MPRTYPMTNFPQEQVIGALWDYAEDGLVERARTMTDDDLRKVRHVADQFRVRKVRLPNPGFRITANHVIAMAAITVLEGRLRPLNQGRCRAVKDRPKFQPAYG